METQSVTRTAARAVLAIVAAMLVAALVVVSTAQTSVAQTDPYGNGGPTVKPTLITDDSDPGDPPQENRICCELPFTGGEVTSFLALGLAAIGTGTVLVRRSRRREPGGIE